MENINGLQLLSTGLQKDLLLLVLRRRIAAFGKHFDDHAGDGYREEYKPGGMPDARQKADQNIGDDACKGHNAGYSGGYRLMAFDDVHDDGHDGDGKEHYPVYMPAAYREAQQQIDSGGQQRRQADKQPAQGFLVLLVHADTPKICCYLHYM